MLAHIISSNKTLEEIRAELEDEADDEAVVASNPSRMRRLLGP